MYEVVEYGIVVYWDYKEYEYDDEEKFELDFILKG